MQIQFLGGAQTVTGSQHLITAHGKNILLECGLFQGRRRDTYEKNLNFEYNPADIDVMLPLIADYCTYDGHDFDEAFARRALSDLLDDRGKGLAWLILDEGEIAGAMRRAGFRSVHTQSMFGYLHSPAVVDVAWK